MPVIGISVERLAGHLGVRKTAEELFEILESLGCDVEDAVQMALYNCPACHAPAEALERDDAPRRCAFCGHEQATPFEAAGRDEVVRLDLLPDRPDLFDPGGLARAIKGFLGLESGLPAHDVAPGNISVTVYPALSETTSYRPFIACAEVTLPALDHGALRDLMKLQENLHWGIGRDRKLASIGVYDLDTLTPPIAYRAVGPDELRFCPLGLPGQPMTPREILEAHPKGTAYAHLLAQHQRYPLLVDAAGQVLSLPPIINSEETRVKVGSTRLFVDVTGTTAVDVERALHTLVASLVEMGGTLRSVDTGGRTTPDLSPRSMTLSLPETNRWLGLQLSSQDLARLAGRMRLDLAGGPDQFEVRYPAYRSDVKHPVDLMEDIAIGHGYHAFDWQVIPSVTRAEERPEELLSNLVRQAMLGLGYDEVTTLFQQTEANHFRKLRSEPHPDCVRLANAKSAEHDLLRIHLLSGLLELLAQNKRKPAPLRLFELGNVIRLDPAAETGTTETRRLAFVVMGPDAGYAEVRATLDAVLHELGWTPRYEPASFPWYIEGRCAGVDAGPDRRALLGELHPESVCAFGLPYPVAACELDLLRVI